MADHGASTEVREAHGLETPVQPRMVGTDRGIHPNRTVQMLRQALVESLLTIDGNHCPHCMRVNLQNLAVLDATEPD